MKRYKLWWLFGGIAAGVIFYVASLALYPEWGQDARALIALAVVAIPAGFELAKKIKDLVDEKEKTPALAGVNIQTIGQEGSNFAAPVTLQPGSTLVAHDQIIQQLPPEPVFHPLQQLPSPPADFTGREWELKQLLAAAESRNVKISALQGMGGVGKTALALVRGRPDQGPLPGRADLPGPEGRARAEPAGADARRGHAACDPVVRAGGEAARGFGEPAGRLSFRAGGQAGPAAVRQCQRRRASSKT